MNATEKGKAHYYAFISHKSTDAKFALKLQRFIETYDLPAHIRQMTDPSVRRLSPICSYEVDFSSAPLLDEMRGKLERSDYLILICSEELLKAGTKYVNYEIRTFIECKEAQGIDPLSRIIPVIVSGEFGSAEHECCPEALQELGDRCPIALDRKKYKTNRELFLRVIGGLLRVDHAVLADRDKKRQRTRKTIAAVILGLLLVVGIGLGEYYIPRQASYTDFVMKNGLPEGIGPLSAADCRQMKGYYVMTICQHKIQSLEYKNAYGNRIDHGGNVFDGDRPSAYLFRYTDDGLSSVTYEDKLGNPYFILQYSGDSVAAADLRDPYDPGEAFYIGTGFGHDPSMLLADINWSSRSDISRFRYDIDQAGYVAKLFFCADSTGRLAQDNGVYGFEYVRDEQGRVVETYFLDALGQRRLNAEGIYCRKYVYDDRNDLVEWINYGRNGMPVANEEGIVHCVFSYDTHHNRTGFSFFDGDGAPVFVASYGGAGQKQYVDQQGNLTLVELLDTDGNPSQSSAYSAMAFTYDENGFTASRTYQNAKAEAVVNPDQAYATVRYINDPKGNPLEITFHDAQGNLVDNAHGYAKEVVEYAADGSWEAHAYYDQTGKPADYRGYGYASMVTDYDERGRECAVRYYGREGEPVNIAGPIYGFGYHRLETVYEYGAHTKQVQTYYDAAGNPVNMQSASGEEYAKTVLIVQNGEITYMANYCADGSVYGYVMESETERSAQAEPITTYRYTDGNGSVLQEMVMYYRLNGVQKRQTFTVYDENQKVSTEREVLYYENGERKTERVKEYDEAGTLLSEYLCEYDDQGILYKEALTDPTSENARTYTVESVYDDAGSLAKEIHTSYRADGIATSITVYTFDANGVKKSAETSYLDETGTVYTRTIREYDGALTLAVTEYTYGADGEISMIIARQNNADGTAAVWECWDYDDGGVLFAHTQFVFDPDGTEIQTTTYYDEEGNVIDVSQRVLDAAGNVIE